VTRGHEFSRSFRGDLALGEPEPPKCHVGDSRGTLPKRVRRCLDASTAAKRGQVSRRRFVPLSLVGSPRVEGPAGRKIVAAAVAAAAAAAAAISGAAAAFGGSRALRARRPG